MSLVTCSYSSSADCSVWQVSKQRLSCRTSMHVLTQFYSLCVLYLLCFCAMQYNCINTMGNILHPLTARMPMSLMLVWSCSLVALALWLQITFSGVYGPSGKSATFVSHPGGGCKPVWSLHSAPYHLPTTLLPPFSKRPWVDQNSIHKLLSKQGRGASLSSLKAILFLGTDSLGTSLISFGMKKEKAAVFPLLNQLLRTLMMLTSPASPIIYLLKFEERENWMIVYDIRGISLLLLIEHWERPGVGSFLAVLAL